MAGIPDQAVLGEVEAQVQREAKFDDAEVGSEVGRPGAKNADQLVSHLPGELRKLLVRERVQVGRAGDAGQDLGHQRISITGGGPSTIPIDNHIKKVS